jgi:hypothetical protein
MNTKRTKFVQSPSHKINVTPYWLLGLIEGVALLLKHRSA